MKKIILALLFPVLLVAQEYELGKVTLQELNQKNHPSDTSAVAAILFHKGKTYFDYVENSHFILVSEIEIKIKIYKKKVWIGLIKKLPIMWEVMRMKASL